MNKKAPIMMAKLNPINLEYGYFQKEPNPKITTPGTTPTHRICVTQCSRAESLLVYIHRPAKYNFSSCWYFNANIPYINPNPTECNIHNANIEVWISIEVMDVSQIRFKFAKSTYDNGVFTERILKIMMGIIVSTIWIEIMMKRWTGFLSFSRRANVL